MGIVYYLRIGSPTNERYTYAFNLDNARKRAINILRISTSKTVYIERLSTKETKRRPIENSVMVGYVKKDGKDWVYHNMEKKIIQYLHEDGSPHTYH